MLKHWMTNQLHSPGRFPARLMLPVIWNRRNRILNEITLNNLDVTAGDSILEVGIGGGYLVGRMIPLLSDGYLVGIDNAPMLIRRAQKKFNRQIDEGAVSIQCADVRKLPFPDGAFNKVCSVNSFFYWKDTAAGFNEISRVLQVSGRLVLTFTAAECLRDRFCFDENHIFDPKEISGLLEHLGFHHVRCATHADQVRQFHCCVAEKK